MKRMNDEASLSQILLGEGCSVYEAEENEKEIILHTQMDHVECECPKCGHKTSEISSDYFRRLQHVPLKAGKSTIIDLHTYKYQCTNPECRAVFTQPLSFARKSQVRTDALNMLILAFCIFVSNNGAARILGEMGVKISPNTIQNMIDRIEFRDNPDVTEIGVDDIAIHKGYSYATVVYDSKTREPLALLEGRDGKTFKEWLLKHPKITMVERDRATAYARVISDVLPECVQIADRFHLLQNLTDYLRDYVYPQMPEKVFILNGEILDDIPKLPVKRQPVQKDFSGVHYTLEWPLDSEGKPLEINCNTNRKDHPRIRKEAEKREMKAEKIREVQKLRQERKSWAEICSGLNISAPTAQRYAQMSEADIADVLRPHSKRKPEKHMKYIPLIYKMLLDGFGEYDIAQYLLSEYKPDSTFRALQTLVHSVKVKNGLCDTKAVRVLFPKATAESQNKRPEFTRLIRSDIFRSLIREGSGKGNPKFQPVLEQLKEKYPVLREAAEMYSDFYSALMGSDAEQIDRFVDKYEEIEPLKKFCLSIKKDTAPVKNAVSYSQSSGYVEGMNQKVKVIKRIVYGRIGLVNLEKRIKLAFQSNAFHEFLPRLLWDVQGRIQLS